MTRIETLLKNYSRHIRLPLKSNAAPVQRVWFAVYPPEEERRLCNRIGEFELSTKDAGYHWRCLDLRNSLADWLETVAPDERNEWFAHPKDIELYARSDYKILLVDKIRAEFAAAREADRTIFALCGLSELFNYLHVSDIISVIEEAGFPGFLLVFFPGEREENTYRFLCARDGWNYLAVPILSEREITS